MLAVGKRPADSAITMTTPESPSLSEESLRAQLEAALSPGKTSAFFTVFYAALAVGLYFGIKH